MTLVRYRLLLIGFLGPLIEGIYGIKNKKDVLTAKNRVIRRFKQVHLTVVCDSSFDSISFRVLVFFHLTHSRLHVYVRLQFSLQVYTARITRVS